MCRYTRQLVGRLMVDDSDGRFLRFTFAPGVGSPFEPPAAPLPLPPTPARAEELVAAPAALPPARAARSSHSQPITRRHISQLTPEVFEAEFRSRGVPVVIQGALDAGNERWRLKRFVDLFDADASFQCRIHGGDSFATTPDRWRHQKSHARHVVWTSPSKFAHTIATGVAQREDCYVQANIQRTRAGQLLASALDAIGAVTGLELHEQYGAIVNMWWGAPDHTEPLHMDVTDGTLCQLRGRKTIHLFPPTSWHDLYPFPASASGMSWAFSQVRQSQPDLDRFPKLRDALAQRIELILDEGEVLFIPACCAHEIRGEPLLADGTPAEHVLSMNRFWKTDAAQVRQHLPQDALKSFNASQQ